MEKTMYVMTLKRETVQRATKIELGEFDNEGEANRAADLFVSNLNCGVGPQLPWRLEEEDHECEELNQT